MMLILSTGAYSYFPLPSSTLPWVKICLDLPGFWWADSNHALKISRASADQDLIDNRFNASRLNMGVGYAFVPAFMGAFRLT